MFLPSNSSSINSCLPIQKYKAVKEPDILMATDDNFCFVVKKVTFSFVGKQLKNCGSENNFRWG